MKNMAFMIHVSPETFQRSGYGSVTGQIFITDQGFAFPESHWNDFAVVIMGWWTEEMLKIWTGTSHQIQCRFMDGPFGFEISLDCPEVWNVRFLESGKQGKCLNERSYPAKSIVNAFITASDLIIKTCQEKNWTSRDLDILVANHKALYALICEKRK